MQKVVYSISKVNRDEKLKGVGYLVEGNLLIPAISQKGNTYIRVFEDVTDKCKSSVNKPTEFKGYVTVAYKDVPVFVEKDNNYEILDYVETTYYIWFKYVD